MQPIRAPVILLAVLVDQQVELVPFFNVSEGHVHALLSITDILHASVDGLAVQHQGGLGMRFLRTLTRALVDQFIVLLVHPGALAAV